MQGRDEVTIAITFFIGLVGGFYFFLTGYAPYVEQLKGDVFSQDPSAVESLIVVGKQYGGCERGGGCASFQIQHDGAYNYLPYSVLRGATPVQGTLPRAILKELLAVTATSKLRLASQVSTGRDCSSYVDGIDYVYEIVREGEFFVLDTCTTALSEHPEILGAFGSVWNYVDSQ